MVIIEIQTGTGAYGRLRLATMQQHTERVRFAAQGDKAMVKVNDQPWRPLEGATVIRSADERLVPASLMVELETAAFAYTEGTSHGSAARLLYRLYKALTGGVE